MTDLAELTDVVKAMGRDLTEAEKRKAVPVLEKASELFRHHSKQLFTPNESEVRLLAHGGKVYLRQRPVTAVLSVTDDQGREVPFTRFQQWLTIEGPRAVIVKYQHGGEVPALVRTTVAEVCKKVLSVSKRAQEGITQYSTTDGPFTDSETYATWAQGGQTTLAPEDKAIAESFRVKVPRLWVSTA